MPRDTQLTGRATAASLEPPRQKGGEVKRAGGSEAGTSEGRGCMEDGSETGRQQGKGAHAHKQCPDLRLAPRDGQRPDLRLVLPLTCQGPWASYLIPHHSQFKHLYNRENNNCLPHRVVVISK